MSDPMIYGKPEIFWTAWEAIGTVLAFFLAFLILLQDRIRVIFFSPRVTAYDGGMFFTWPSDDTAGELELEWSVKNISPLNIFGNDIHGLTTLYGLSMKGHLKSSFYSDQIIESKLFLPKNGTFYQHQSIPRKSLSTGDYYLILLFKSQDKEVGRKTFDLHYGGRDNK